MEVVLLVVSGGAAAPGRPLPRLCRPVLWPGPAGRGSALPITFSGGGRRGHQFPLEGLGSRRPAGQRAFSQWVPRFTPPLLYLTGQGAAVVKAFFFIFTLDFSGKVWYNVSHTCGYSTSASITAFQAVEVGSIPITRSRQNRLTSSGIWAGFLFCTALYTALLFLTEKIPATADAETGRIVKAAGGWHRRARDGFSFWQRHFREAAEMMLTGFVLWVTCRRTGRPSGSGRP